MVFTLTVNWVLLRTCCIRAVMPLIGNIPTTCLKVKLVTPSSEDENGYAEQVTVATLSLVMPVMAYTDSFHSVGEGGVTEGGTALDDNLILS